MIRSIRKFIAVITACLVMSGATIPAVGAIDVFPECTGPGSTSAVCRARNTDNVDSIAQSITKLLLWIIGVVAVIMLVVGGLRYITSNGNPEQIKSAKNTVMYAIVGLVVAMMGYAIVTYVVSWF